MQLHAIFCTSALRARTLALDAPRPRDHTKLPFLGQSKAPASMLSSNTAKDLKKERTQVNKTFCEIKWEI